MADAEWLKRAFVDPQSDTGELVKDANQGTGAVLERIAQSIGWRPMQAISGGVPLPLIGGPSAPPSPVTVPVPTSEEDALTRLFAAELAALAGTAATREPVTAPVPARTAVADTMPADTHSAIMARVANLRRQADGLEALAQALPRNFGQVNPAADAALRGLLLLHSLGD